VQTREAELLLLPRRNALAELASSDAPWLPIHTSSSNLHAPTKILNHGLLENPDSSNHWRGSQQSFRCGEYDRTRVYTACSVFCSLVKDGSCEGVHYNIQHYSIHSFRYFCNVSNVDEALVNNEKVMSVGRLTTRHVIICC